MLELQDTAPSSGLPFARADIEQTIPARFEQVVSHFSDRIALTGGDRTWTYRELNRQVNRIARAILESAGAGPGCVAYLLDHSPEMVIATLAVLKAGKAHLRALAENELYLKWGSPHGGSRRYNSRFRKAGDPKLRMCL